MRAGVAFAILGILNVSSNQVQAGNCDSAEGYRVDGYVGQKKGGLYGAKIRDQGELGTCYAQTASQMIQASANVTGQVESYGHAPAPSALWSGLLTGSSVTGGDPCMVVNSIAVGGNYCVDSCFNEKSHSKSTDLLGDYSGKLLHRLMSNNEINYLSDVKRAMPKLTPEEIASIDQMIKPLQLNLIENSKLLDIKYQLLSGANSRLMKASQKGTLEFLSWGIYEDSDRVAAQEKAQKEVTALDAEIARLTKKNQSDNDAFSKALSQKIMQWAPDKKNLAWVLANSTLELSDYVRDFVKTNESCSAEYSPSQIYGASFSEIYQYLKESRESPTGYWNDILNARMGIGLMKYVCEKGVDCLFPKPPKRLVPGVCKEYGQNKSQTLAAHFNSGSLEPMGISYCSALLTQGSADPAGLTKDMDRSKCGPHASVISGCRTVGGRAEFLIRNSWGTDCSHYHSRFQAKCSMGSVWVTAAEIDNYSRVVFKIVRK